MDDRLDDRFAEAVRGALMEQVRTSAPVRTQQRAARPPRRRIELVWAGVVAAVAVIAVVVGAVSLSALQRRADPATPAAPVQPFDGDCRAVLADSAVGDLVGAKVRRTDVASDVEGLPLRLAGALRCGWSGAAEAQQGTGLSLVVASADLPGAVTRDPDCFSSSAGGPDQWSCAFDAVDGGTWFSGFVTTAAGTSESATRVARTGLLTALAAREAQSRAALPRRATGAWPRLGCEALAKRVDLARLLGLARVDAAETGQSGESPEGLTAAVRWSRQTACSATDDQAADATAFVDVRALPGGAWLEGDVASTASASAAPSSLPSSAVRIYVLGAPGGDINAPDAIVLWAFDGPNALRLEGTHTTQAQLRAVATALLRTLDGAG